MSRNPRTGRGSHACDFFCGLVYLADFDLALSQGFRLGADEQQFFELHQNFDLCTAINSLVHATVTHYDAADDWRQTLRDLVETTSNTPIPAAIHSYLFQGRRWP